MPKDLSVLVADKNAKFNLDSLRNGNRLVGAKIEVEPVNFFAER